MAGGAVVHVHRFAIAGLLQDDFRDNNNQVPWLGDIPVLGTLFRSADYQRSQTELVRLTLSMMDISIHVRIIHTNLTWANQRQSTSTQ